MEPEIANAFCSYPYDGNQRNFNCVPPGKSDQCTPGCRSSSCTHTRDWECSFPGDDLKSMLEVQSERHSGDHNEVWPAPQPSPGLAQAVALQLQAK